MGRKINNCLIEKKIHFQREYLFYFLKFYAKMALCCFSHIVIYFEKNTLIVKKYKMN